jgi:riboflavin kinase/FMN adenylyltransferase
MIIARSLEEIRRDTNSVVTVGTFDGVHLAHQEIVREVVNTARLREGRSTVVTFDPHPKEIVGKTGQPVALLSTPDERIRLLGNLDVDLLVIIRFTFEFSRLSSREFYHQCVVERIGVTQVVVGYDHMFGRDRKGNIEELVRMGKEFNFSVSAVHPYTVDGRVVSSSLIRKALAAGDVGSARAMLGYDYVLSGTVVRGDGRGVQLGFPTANIEPEDKRKLIPGRGVYVVGVQVDGNHYHGMMNIGIRPTVNSAQHQVNEVHIFDFNGGLYGKKITVTFHRRLRDERKFSSLEDLSQQLRKDKETSLGFLLKQSSH